MAFLPVVVQRPIAAAKAVRAFMEFDLQCETEKDAGLLPADGTNDPFAQGTSARPLPARL
jgi:hypothetical protein